MLDSLRFNPDAKVPMQEFLSLSLRHWSSDRRWVSFRNTAIYAPIAYLPGALVSYAARHGRATIFQTSYAVRAANALCTIALCAMGIAVARRGKLYLVVLSSLPMVLALGASCSQDGVIIGLSVLTAALLTGVEILAPGATRFWVIITALFAVLAVSKPPLVLCSLIPLGFVLRDRAWLRALPIIFSIAAVLVWQKLGSDPAKVLFRQGFGVSAGGQVQWVLSHPLQLPSLAFNTLKINAVHNIHEFFGVLGWLDTIFPQWFYRSAYAGIAITSLFCFFPALRQSDLRQSGCITAITIIAVLLAVCAVYFSLYVIWTSVGAPVIDGVQGRYFLPIAPFLALIFPKVSVEGLVASSLRTHQIAMLALGLCLAIDMVTLTCVLASRYWLA